MKSTTTTTHKRVKMEIDWIIKGLLNSVKSTSAVAPSSIINKHNPRFDIRRQYIHEATAFLNAIPRHLNIQSEGPYRCEIERERETELNYSSESFTCFLLFYFCCACYLVYKQLIGILVVFCYVRKIRKLYVSLTYIENMTIRTCERFSSNQFKCFHVNAECFCGRNVTLFTLILYQLFDR